MLSIGSTRNTCKTVFHLQTSHLFENHFEEGKNVKTKLGKFVLGA